MKVNENKIVEDYIIKFLENKPEIEILFNKHFPGDDINNYTQKIPWRKSGIEMAFGLHTPTYKLESFGEEFDELSKEKGWNSQWDADEEGVYTLFIYESDKEVSESMKLKKFEAWSELSMSNKLKLGLGAAAAITGATVIAINDSDTKITESDGTIRQGVAGEEFTGTVTYSNRSVDLYNFHNVGIECKDGTLVEVSIDLSDIKRRNIKEGSVITISITEDTWMFRNDADVVESMKYLKRFSEINESLPRQHTVDQLKRLRKLTKGTDIGDRISDMNKEGANIQYIQNPIDSGIESYEDYEKANKKFIPSWNLKHLSGPFGKKVTKVKQ